MVCPLATPHLKSHALPKSRIAARPGGTVGWDEKEGAEFEKEDDDMSENMGELNMLRSNLAGEKETIEEFHRRCTEGG